MNIEYDAAKDQINREKHGVPLNAASELDLARAVVVEDLRFDYGETRFIAYTPLRGVLHVLWYTWRGGTVRVIGLRKANARERQRDQRSTGEA